MDWFEVRFGVDEQYKDAIASRMWELGARGVVEGVREGEPLQAYFPLRDRNRITEEIRSYVEGLTELHGKPFPWEVLDVPDTDWSESYKEFYRAQALSDRFFLVPAWDRETRVPEGSVPLILEPGQAFGTGLHGSTRVCLRFLEQDLPGSNPRLADVGTGTGILAIAARLLGVTDIVAVDNDPVAIGVARENLVRNGVDFPLLVGSTENLEGTYDYLVANILLEAHEALWKEYLRLLRPGGTLVLAGLLVEQEEETRGLFEGTGLRWTGKEVLGEWLGLRGKKEG